MESHEAHVGTLVRLLDGGKRKGKGNIGTIEQTYGHPDYLAMDVRFEDGNAELCWHHELAKVDKDITVQSLGPMLVECGNANERQGSKLPFGYYLQPDADLLMLLRPDCSLVAAFSAMGADALEGKAMVWEDAD